MPSSTRQSLLNELWAAPLTGALFAARAWATAPFVEASLRVLGYRRTLRFIEAASARGGASPSQSRRGISVSLGERLVRAAYKAHPFSGACLSRSLVQYRLHLRDGTPARFVIGVRRPASEPAPERSNDPGASRIEAHAWIEDQVPPPASENPFTTIFDSCLIDGGPA